jgi:hypothetical protein
MPSQREQYENIVHLFIGTGRSPCKITSRPFAFDNNSIVIYLGLDSLFLFKSVSSFLPSCRSSLAHSFGSVPSFVFFPCFFILWVLVRRSLSTHYTPETLLNHVFEDLRKPKAPNRPPLIPPQAISWQLSSPPHIPTDPLHVPHKNTLAQGSFGRSSIVRPPVLGSFFCSSDRSIVRPNNLFPAVMLMKFRSFVRSIIRSFIVLS